MDFQVVVLAGGFSKTLVPLVSKEVPKALLPVANRPVLSYVLELLEHNDLKNAIVVVEGESAALLISSWISSTFVDRLDVEVTAVPEDVGTAGALRSIDHRLTAKDILVVSGDLVSEIPPGAVAAAHRRHDAVVTAMLCSVPVSGPSDSGSSGSEVDKDIRVQKSILRAVGQMEIRADLMDAHMYAFKRSVLQDVLNQKETFQSLRREVLPYLVRTQLRSELLLNGAQSEENGNGKDALQNSKILLSQLLANASTPSFHEIYALGPAGSAPTLRKTHKCCVYIANKSKYCARLNSIQAFSDINRDVTGDANHLSGYTFSAQNNIIHPSAVLGSKTTVGPQCMLGEGSQMGDKCSVKKLPFVVLNHVTIGDGCSIQGSIICSNVQLQERAVLKDCQVGAGFVVTAGSEHKGESLAKKEKQ
ncbi:UNVERIFIED_CONTAM: Translation initiation factor eIF-2B subunit gamma [Sesamum angustifolium]|uniref:Translation initiation factor eIF2B subunit gamma n=1 Tax=Sesamum angustifolium TaxID=2727405 RepID=A0AAW2QTI1_9LAMI